MKKQGSILDAFKGYESSLVTVVLISCGRMDLLKRTIESFLRFNTFPIYEFIIIEDSGNKKMHGELIEYCSEDSLFRIILNSENIGLIASIDKAYSFVKTEYVMHVEDDWEFYNSGFIEKSLEILMRKSQIMFVWLRGLKDTNGHPVEEKLYRAGNVDYRLMATGVEGKWHGFGFNPGLRRLSDYKKVGLYSNIAPNESTGMRECYVGQEYFKLGFRAATLLDGYTKHIGDGRRTYTL